MKATELRIGNYCREITPFINHITKVKVVHFENIENGEIDLFPIPLTEDWLERAGADQRPLLGHTRLAWFIDGIEPPEWIEYVHELQNWHYWKFMKTEIKFKNE